MTTASVAVVCLGTLLAACGSDSSAEDDGYVAVGAVGATPDRTPQRTVAPTGEVRMVPLEGAGEGSGSKGGGSGSGGSGSDGGTGTGGTGGTGSGSSEGAPSGDPASPPATPEPGTPAEGGNSGSGEGSSDDSEPPGSGDSDGSGEDTQQPSGPAVLKIGEPVRKALEERWCEKVTVKFHNSGGTAVRSGTVTFGTHVIGGLGVDWATVESERKLPAPIEPGETVTESWNLCVDAWRVPLGMRIETQDVSVKWK
ncbi:hypothetical protein [Streptomyces cavernicola]|uniref:Secreted protein n=1 Tax=Streptomyces cavernicola TaxID=3043613 RepID=A0ABT6S5F7_9ACTN|nr:hypothetical protein [Streptomyces sp. B-S-A6]MDI3402653.1 hypothetical protein [Streptomyces sp. B-S-A6]